MALFFIGQAHAVDTWITFDENGNIIGSSSAAQRSQLLRDLSAYNSGRAPMPANAMINGGMVTMERAATMQLGAGSGLGSAVRVALKDIVTSPVASIGKGVASVARATPAGIAGTVAASILLDAGISWVNGQWTKAGVPEQAPNGTPYPSSMGYWEVAGNYRSGSYEQSCSMYAAGITGGQFTYSYSGFRSVALNTGYCQLRRVHVPSGEVATVEQQAVQRPGCASGHTLSNGTCYPPGYVPPKDSAPATDAQIQQAVTDGLSRNPSQAMDVLKNIYDNGGWVPLDVADSAGWTLPTTPVKGQPSTTTSNSTAPNGDSLTTTRTTTPTLNLGTTGNTAGNNGITYNVTNNTTTTTTNNTTGQTSTETETQDAPITFTDAAMPDLPKLYTQKYPEGLAGVWRSSAPDVQNTQFFQGVKSMFPSFGAGQCPVWRMNFAIGKMGNFGTGDLTVPCWIFQALGLVVLATAAFTARKIIF
ncbi:hypothetical protein [Cupriavidus pauculus]|jgi:hypothetical protein|uniref:hypothetical protein n=1 Tax=Cupriavidus pauculus TaxID=82633 RepID=UPI001247A150|nr:hypothetical protein [Cupriavidus pauculus]KAB0605198.1 hypothetical protein F7R19_01345 [Cupriavidus pauculus]UAK99556.1 hypothetical protein K8O84_16535 [Cupriavidus pauculus]